jgi:hypothetical protein
MGAQDVRGIRPFSRDRLMVTNRDNAARVAFGALDRIQQDTPEEAMAGAALLFVALCKRCGLTGNEAYELGDRMLQPQAFHDKANMHMETIRDFAGMRIMGDAHVDNPIRGR